MDKYIKCLGDPEGRVREDSRRGDIHICPEIWTGFYQVGEEWQRGQGHSKQKELYVQMYRGIKYASPLENHSKSAAPGVYVNEKGWWESEEIVAWQLAACVLCAPPSQMHSLKP